MKAICKFVFALFLLATVSSVSAQDYYYSHNGKPIQLGDSVLVAVAWNATPEVEQMHFDDLMQPSKEDIQKRRFAFFVYPKATRIVNVISIARGKRRDQLAPPTPAGIQDYFRNYFTIRVFNKDGIEIRDSLSDKPNAPVDIRKVPIAPAEEISDFSEAAGRIYVAPELRKEFEEYLKSKANKNKTK